MKMVLLVLICIFSFNCSAFDHSYNVSGEDAHGKKVEGVIYSTNGEPNVNGELSDEKGNTQEFCGQWNGYGQISGETVDGTSLELTTN